MKSNEKIEIRGGDIVHNFISEITLSPKSIKKVVMISPFVALNTNSKTIQKFRESLIAVTKSGGCVRLVSEKSKIRFDEFHKALGAEPIFKNILGLCPKLHAKCGYAVKTTGMRMAFMGSANFTENGLYTNEEISMSVKISKMEGIGWSIFNGIKNRVDYFLNLSESIS
jgi:hypothetical protein